MRKLFFILTAGLYLISCKEPYTEVKENIFSAQDNALAENEYHSTIEAIADWVGNTKFYKKADQILPGNVKVFYIDSSFSDLDGVEGSLNFGSLGTSKPFGLLCSDGKYRAGRIHFSLNKQMELPGSKLQIWCESSDSFYTGSGREMNRLTGTFTLENPNGLQLIIKADKIKLSSPSGITMEWSCNRIIRLVKDIGKGIWGDIYSLEGSAWGINRNGEPFTASIDEPLLKKMEVGCSKTFVKGRLSVQNETSDKIIKVNYDPNNDGACDLMAEAEINGKKTRFVVE